MVENLNTAKKSLKSRDPFEVFNEWFALARACGHSQPEAFALGTVNAAGLPQVRFLLLKGVSKGHFQFFTNYGSAKAAALDSSGHGAMTFFWERLERQVRIEGTVERATAEESDAYFKSRARGSQLGAWASPQSQVIASKKSVEERLAKEEARFDKGEVPRPDHWGGYNLTPLRIEFWTGQNFRLHDREVFRRASPKDPWTYEILAP